MKVKLDDASLEMELDTGAAASLISKTMYDKLWAEPPAMRPTTVRLRTYSGQSLTVLGTVNVSVQYETQQVEHSILVVDGSGPNLFGRDLLAVLKVNWKALSIQYATCHQPLQEILSKHEALFRTELGKTRNIEATLSVEDNATPQFCRARPVPYALREKVERELDRLQQEGIIEPVTFSEWAAPIVPVSKPDGSIRLCGDYKLTVNRAAKVDRIPCHT